MDLYSIHNSIIEKVGANPLYLIHKVVIVGLILIVDDSMSIRLVLAYLT